jgi:predicted XRE-type DNA-binding protein
MDLPDRAARGATPSESSGNVFADLGLKNPEELLAKAELVQRICDIIAARKLTQVRAAKLLGIDQPKVSALMRGRLDGFSTDRLFRLQSALGSGVEIIIRPAHRGREADPRARPKRPGTACSHDARVKEPRHVASASQTPGNYGRAGALAGTSRTLMRTS